MAAEHFIEFRETNANLQAFEFLRMVSNTILSYNENGDPSWLLRSLGGYMNYYWRTLSKTYGGMSNEELVGLKIKEQ